MLSTLDQIERALLELVRLLENQSPSDSHIPENLVSVVRQTTELCGDLRKNLLALSTIPSSSAQIPDALPTEKQLKESFDDSYSVLYSVATAACDLINEDESPGPYRIARGLQLTVRDLGRLLERAGLLIE